MSDPRPAKRMRDIGEPPPEPRDGFTAVARVVKPHGIRGEVRVQSFNPSGRNIEAGRFVFLAGERHKVLRARPDRGGWIVQLSRLSSRDAAEGARGLLLEVPDADVIRDDDESHFIHELVGLRVRAVDGAEVGRITDVLQPGANDVYVVSGPGGEVLVPAIGDVVKSIDIAAGEVAITPLSEWLDESE